MNPRTLGILAAVCLGTAWMLASLTWDVFAESSREPADPAAAKLREGWLQDLKGDSTTRQAQAAGEIVEWLTDNKKKAVVDASVIESLAALLARDEMATYKQYTRFIGDWCKETLIKIGQPAVPALIAATLNENVKVGRRAAEAMGEIQNVGPRGIEALINLLAHANHEVSGAASNALKKMTEPTLIPKLVAASEQGGLKGRCYATNVLGAFQDDLADAALLKSLDAPERELRLWAAYAVGGTTTHPKLGPEYISRLKTDDREIRGNLETALRLCAQQNIGHLVKGFADADPRVRAGCVKALIGVNGEAAQISPALKKLLHDEDATVRSNVLYIVQINITLFDAESLVGPLTKGLVDADPQMRAQAAAALARFAEHWKTDRRPVESLLKALDDAEPDVVVNAIRALAAFHEPKAIPTLTRLAALQEKKSEPVAREASRALGGLGGKNSIEVLRQNLARKDPTAIEALGKLHDRESIPKFIELLKDPDQGIRSAAVEALALNPDPRAIEPLIEQLNSVVSVFNFGRHSENENIRRRIAEALGRSGDRRAIDALIERIDNANPGHDPQFGETADNPRLLDHDLINHPFAWPLFHAGFVALPELSKGLSSKSTTTRQLCAWVLANLSVQGDLESGDLESIAPGILSSLRDPDPVVRYCLVKAVGSSKLRETEQLLLDLLESPVPEAADPTDGLKNRPANGTSLGNQLSPATQIQIEVIRSLSNFKSDRVRDALLQALKHREAAVRSAAAGHLGGFPAAATVEPLIKALADPGASAQAARVLGHVDDSRAIAPLIEIVRTSLDPIAQANAAQSLGLLGATDAKPVLRDVLESIPAGTTKSESFATQMAAAISLAQLHDEAGTARLKELLGSDDYETRSNVAAHLGTATYFSTWRPSAALSHEPTREVLRYFAEHAPDTPTRLQLFNALGGQLDEPTRAFLERRARDPRESIGWAAWRVLVRPDPAAYEEQLLELLNTGSDYARKEIVWFLGQVPTARVTDRLLETTSAPDEELRVAVVIALRNRRSTTVDAKLRELSTNDSSPRVRARAAKILIPTRDR